MLCCLLYIPSTFFRLWSVHANKCPIWWKCYTLAVLWLLPCQQLSSLGVGAGVSISASWVRLLGKQFSCKEEPCKKCLGKALPGSSALCFRGLHCSMVSCSERASSQSLSPKVEHWKTWYWPISLKFMAVFTAQHQQKMGIFKCQVQKVLASGSVEDLCHFR